MRLHLASPNWPAETRLGGSSLRRFGFQYFLLLSLLVHGLALLLKFDFRPFFPVDRGTRLGFHDRGVANFSVELRTARHAPVTQPDAEPARAVGKAARSNSPLSLETSPAQTIPIARVPTLGTIQPAIDASDLLERSKAEMNAASRRQMLDPMFAPASRSAGSSPLEKSTANRVQTIEHFNDKLIRVTSASGRRYCLQGLPEIATRDIPTPVLSIPMNCP